MSTLKPVAGQQPADLIRDAATHDNAAILERLKSTPTGLTEEEAAERLEVFGANEVGQEKHYEWLHRFWTAIRNPLVILLSALATISYATGDMRAGTVMLLMVILGVTLRFVQETRANNAAAKLKAMIKVTATVLRDGQPKEVPLRDLVPGDVVKLSAGDMIPADVRLIAAKDLFIIQATLTGESLPVEKHDATDPRPGVASIEHTNICFLGTSVESGAATAVVVATGQQTYFGKMAASLSAQQTETAFDRGVKHYVWLMLAFMMVMVPTVFLINGLMKHNWKDAFFFAMAVAVGLTPEMLPMIVSVCLSKGALAMSRKKVIVKKLNSIQNFGAMDVLCTDKTGTLTIDHVILEIHCDVFKNESEEVLRDAYLLSHFQTGLKNVLDRAVLKYKELHTELGIDKYKMIDEIPFDFSRRMMSVAVEGPDGRQLLTKGAPEAVFAKCSHFESEGEIFPMEPILVGNLIEQVNSLSEDGFRVLAVATKKLGAQTTFTKADESELVLTGYLAFLDPPKDSAGKAITALRQNGITVKVLTGDNDLVTRKVCSEVGIHTDKIVLGSEVEKMTDEELGKAVEVTDIFARLSPAHKKRVVQALQRNKHVVGFMGDGINDAPALRAADVGLSVDNAVDIAKESADMILLEKDLMVLEEGVLEGRKVFVNILKYIRMGASSNFGNMFSVLGASAWLKFLPMQPIQVLSNNLLYDFSQVPIPTDNVGTAVISKPRPWAMGEIAKFILFIGPISSIFDYTTYALMWFYFKCSDLNLMPPTEELIKRFPIPAADSDHTYAAALFSTGWFVESLMTQTLIVHVIRTNQIPFIQSRASWQLTLTTFAIMGVGAVLPYSPLASSLGFVPLPWQFWPLLGLTLLCYVALTQIIKAWMVKKKWI